MDRQCGSSQQAIHFAVQAVMSGMQDVVIAAGVENMSQVPIGSNIGDSFKVRPLGLLCGWLEDSRDGVCGTAQTQIRLQKAQIYVVV